jgi:glycogen operon protein
VNDTGTGNTLDADHPRVRELVLASLRYWHREMGVDGFRFDLGTVLGRGADGFSSKHPLLRAITEDPELQTARLVSEPWDPGPGGYQLGRFPPRWSEWNDRYRDGLRQFWRGDAGHLAELARRLHGSADLFDAPGRGPLASVNYVASHDGFTLMDAVSYAFRHNEANGEHNRDGHSHNLSCNHGVEGETDRRVVLAMRRRHRINLLASLFLSQGVPMLLAGDEFGNSQGGNNNAYAQDNEIGWLDWAGLERDPEFTQIVRDLLTLRRRHPLLRQPDYVHGRLQTADGARDVDWLAADGSPMGKEDWHASRAVLKLLSGDGEDLAVLVNGHDQEVEFRLPAGPAWAIEFSSDLGGGGCESGRYLAAAWSIACLWRRRSPR